MSLLSKQWAVLSIVSLSMAAVAGEETPLSEEDFFTPFPEVLTATRLVQQLSHAAQFDRFAYSLNASSLKSGGFPNKSDDSDSRILTTQVVYRPTSNDGLFFSAGVPDTDFDNRMSTETCRNAGPTCRSGSTCADGSDPGRKTQ